MGKDLGTYHVRVELVDGRGFIYKWETATRFHGERAGIFKLDAAPIPPPFDSEEDVLNGIDYQFTEGNYACDCNLLDFLDRVNGGAHRDHECGSTAQLQRLTAICPDGRTVVLFDRADPTVNEHRHD